MSVPARPSRRRVSVPARPSRLLSLALCLALAILVLPIQPVVAVEVAPQTRTATLTDVLGRLGAPATGSVGAHGAGGDETEPSPSVARRSDAIEAPLPFTGLGVRGTGVAPALRARTLHLDGSWSAWIEVEMLDATDGPDAGTDEAARAGLDVSAGSPAWSSDAIWAGPSSHVQLEVTGDPDGLEVTFLDTAGLSEPFLARIGRVLGSRTSAAPAEAAATGPSIRPRTDWLPGGVEHRSGTAAAAEVRFAVLHHTATINDYTREQVPQQIRNMHHWHTVNNGWADLGYNFVVDRFGTIWEGRYGGITRGVIGAHAGGWNTGSFGVAMLGNFTPSERMGDHQPDRRALDAAVELLAWKYRVHGIDPDPDARVWVNGANIRPLEGHRNVRQTYIEWKADDSFAADCPGRNLSWRLPTLREGIADAFQAASVPPGPFADVPADHPFVDEVTWLVDGGLATGYPDGTFRPTLPVSRAAMAAFLHRAAGSPTGPHPDPGFADVPASHPFHDEVAWLVASGLADGYEDGTFRPTAPVTRQAVAAMLHRATDGTAGLSDDGTTDDEPVGAFSDVSAGHPFATEIAWLATTGISSGYPDGAFRPAGLTTRQAMAAFLHTWTHQPD